MFYQPKFCSECGEKIVRAEWKFWHSRQFCDLCATKHQVFDATGRFSLLLVPVLLVGFAAAAFIPGRTGNQLQNAAPPARGFVSEGKRKELEPRPADSSQPSLPPEQPKEDTGSTVVKQETSAPATSSEAVYSCGAPTKKGTPCTRRVKFKGFCWQHKESTR